MALLASIIMRKPSDSFNFKFYINIKSDSLELEIP